MADEQNQNLNTGAQPAGQVPTPPAQPVVGVGDSVDLSQPGAAPVQPATPAPQDQKVEVVNYQANQEEDDERKAAAVIPPAAQPGTAGVAQVAKPAPMPEVAIAKEPEAMAQALNTNTPATQTAAAQPVAPAVQPGTAPVAAPPVQQPVQPAVQTPAQAAPAPQVPVNPPAPVAPAQGAPTPAPVMPEALQANPPASQAPVQQHVSAAVPEALQANPPVVPAQQPVPQPAVAQPQGNGNGGKANTPANRKKKQSSGGSLKLLFGLLGVFFFLAVAFYAVLLWGLLGDGLPTEAFAGLGLTEAGLQDTLLALTNGIFGFACFYLLMAFLVRVFQYMMTSKKDARRSRYGWKSFLSFFFFVIFAAGWVMLYWMISNADVQRAAQPTNQNLIVTDPASVTRLQAPIVVQFDIGTRLYQQVPTEQIRKIDWDFNADGEIDASGPTVQYRFQDKGENDGRYPVQASVYYVAAAGGEEQLYQETVEVIIENESVVAVINPNTTQGSAPLAVNFSATASSDPDGQIVRYEWDLDEDGSYELSGPDRDTVDFTYERAGRYTARLRVTGVNNDTAEAQVDIDVQIPQNTLKAVINTVDEISGLSPVEVTLDAEQSISQFGDIVRYEWFVEGEQGSSLGRRIKRTFFEEGDYQVKLVVESESGEKAEETIIITVEEDLGKYEAGIRTTPPEDPDEGFVMGTVPFEVAFDSSVSTVKNPIEWSWDFDSDGIVDDFAPAVRHTFREPGTYTVTLNILDTEDNEYTATKIVQVKGAGLQAKISATPTGGMVPLLVQFDGSGSTIDDGEIIEYVWQFPGAQPISYGPQIEYEFTKLGNQRVVLKVVSSTGDTAETEMLISVRKAAVQADFLPRPAVGDAPLEVLFDPTPSTGTIFQYEWDFGDGKISDEFQPSHIYRVPGTYEVTLKVTDQDGIISTERKQVIVTDPTD